MGWGEEAFRSASMEYVALLAADFLLEGEQYEAGKSAPTAAPAPGPRQREVQKVTRYHSR